MSKEHAQNMSVFCARESLGAARSLRSRFESMLCGATLTFAMAGCAAQGAPSTLQAEEVGGNKRGGATNSEPNECTFEIDFFIYEDCRRFFCLDPADAHMRQHLPDVGWRMTGYLDALGRTPTVHRPPTRFSTEFTGLGRIGAAAHISPQVAVGSEAMLPTHFWRAELVTYIENRPDLVPRVLATSDLVYCQPSNAPRRLGVTLSCMHGRCNPIVDPSR